MVSQVYFDLPMATFQVHWGEVMGVSKLTERIIYTWEWAHIFLCNLIQLLIVDTETLATVLLLDLNYR